MTPTLSERLRLFADTFAPFAKDVRVLEESVALVTAAEALIPLVKAWQLAEASDRAGAMSAHKGYLEATEALLTFALPVLPEAD
jgi:hypothetical protein